jgi:hypothetical protein
MNKKVPKDFLDDKSDGGGLGKFDILCANLDIKTKAGKIFLQRSLENACLMDGKQQDYGSGNISAFGTVGVVIRMSDKFERIKNLFKNKRKRTVNESILDSFTDIANYAIIAQMLERKEWPTE